VPPKPRNLSLTWDDEQDPALEPVRGRVPWPKTPDETDARWEPGWGERGWLSVRDPFTGERFEVPTKYVPTAPWRDIPGAEPAPQWMVRRAMEKLPPRKEKPRR